MAIRQEADQFAGLLVGLLGGEPPTDDEGMAAFASTLAAKKSPTCSARPTDIDGAAKMRYPESTLRHFAKLGSRLAASSQSAMPCVASTRSTGRA